MVLEYNQFREEEKTTCLIHITNFFNGSLLYLFKYINRQNNYGRSSSYMDILINRTQLLYLVRDKSIIINLNNVI